MLLLIIGIMMTVVLSGCADRAPAETIVVSEEISKQASGPQLRKGLQTILVMGLDKFERQNNPKGYLNHMQSDFMLLVVVDPANKTIEAVHINRDTMTKVTRLGVFGAEAGSFVEQIALAHTYGSGGSDSCLNSVKAVSNYLGGMKIDHYMTFTMASVPMINDMVGGVTVKIEDDFSQVDPTLINGQEQTLHGEQALHFVRIRKDVGEQTNIARMRRQRQYMNALYGKMVEAAKADENFIKNLTIQLSDTFMTDCSLSQLDALSKTMAECTLKPFLTIDGEAVVGEEFMEFYPDAQSVQAVVQQLFYEAE